MSNPLLTTTHSKLDTRVKEPSGVQTTHDRFKFLCKIVLTIAKTILIQKLITLISNFLWELSILLKSYLVKNALLKFLLIMMSQLKFYSKYISGGKNGVFFINETYNL